MYDPPPKPYAGAEWRRPSSSEYPIPRQPSGQWTSVHPAHAQAHDRPPPYARQTYDGRRPSYASQPPAPHDWASAPPSARPPAPAQAAAPLGPYRPPSPGPVFRPDYSMRVDERRPSASAAPHDERPSLPPLTSPPPTGSIPIPGALGRGSVSAAPGAGVGAPGEGSLFGGEGRSLPPLKVAIGRRPSYYTP